MPTIPKVFLDVLVGLSPEEAMQQCERADLRSKPSEKPALGNALWLSHYGYDPLRATSESGTVSFVEPTRGKTNDISICSTRNMSLQKESK